MKYVYGNTCCLITKEWNGMKHGTSGRRSNYDVLLSGMLADVPFVTIRRTHELGLAVGCLVFLNMMEMMNYCCAAINIILPPVLL